MIPSAGAVLTIIAVSFSPLARAAVGTTLSVQGRPLLTVKESGERQGLGPGKSVAAGDNVETDQTSRAKIHLIDETILDIKEVSHLIIPQVLAPDSPERQILIEILKGKVRAQVNRELDRTRGKFEIHSYAATLGVEGTDFVVEVSPPDENGLTRTTVAVLDGHVTVRGAKESSGPPLKLTAGMRFTATARLIGETIEQDALQIKDIETLDQAALKEVAKAARLENESFLQTVSLAGGRGFGMSTLQSMAKNLSGDRMPGLRGQSRDSALFRRRFRDDDFNERSNMVTLSIGFPQ